MPPRSDQRTLADVQSAFAASLRDPADDTVMPTLAAATPHTAPHTTLLQARFDVYRNNVASSLADALAALYPVCARLVGEDFFRATAHAYVRAGLHGDVEIQAQDNASLIGFAAGFAGFLVSFAPARSVPYLPDVARLEHAWHRVYHAADADPVTAPDLQHIAEDESATTLETLELALLPAHHLLMSPYPVSRIWEANQPGRDGTVEMGDSGRGERLFVVRPRAEVEIRRVSPGAFAFLSAVQGGGRLGRALIAAYEAESGRSPQQIFAELLTAGSFVRKDPPA